MATGRKLDWTNFHDSTAGSFTRCQAPERKPDFESFSGSRYWSAPNGVIRESNHWCAGIRSCDWLLDGTDCYEPGATGFISYAELAAGTAEREARREREWQEHRERLAAEAALKQPGNTVTCDRQVWVRGRSGRCTLVAETVHFVIARVTSQFVVATDGRRFGLSTLKTWSAA